MKHTLLVLCGIILADAAAHTQTEELAVAEFLTTAIMCSPEWVDDARNFADSEGECILYDNYDDLFAINFPSNHVGETWTPQERKTAFENFIAAIPELSTNKAYRAIKLHGGVALGFCRDHDATNVLGSALRILSSKYSVAQPTALGVFEKFAVPSDAINAFAANMLTNMTIMTARNRSCFLGAYTEVLEKRREKCNPQCFTNGVSIVRSYVDGRDGSIALDILLKASYPNYECSSNRLVLARAALTDSRVVEVYVGSVVERYFSPITNRLLSVQGPLPEVEELR